MANKASRLNDLIDHWRKEAEIAPGRAGTTKEADAERVKTLNECAREVDGVVNDTDHSKD